MLADLSLSLWLTSSRSSLSGEISAHPSQKSLVLWRHYFLENSNRDEESVWRTVCINRLGMCDWMRWFVSLTQWPVWAHTLSPASSSDRSSSIMWSTCLSPLRWHMASVMLCISATREKPLADAALMSVHQCIHQYLNKACSISLTSNKENKDLSENTTNHLFSFSFFLAFSSYCDYNNRNCFLTYCEK